MDSTTSDSPASRPTHLFYPDFWSRLRVGTVLMTDDYHVFVVDEITDDGVISREWNDPRRLWTWDDLRDCIFSNESSAGIGTFVRERAGRIELDCAPPMGDWESLIDKADSNAGSLLDHALAGELLRLLSGRHQSITLRIYARKREGKPDRLVLWLDRGWWRLFFRSKRLRHAAWCQYRCAAARQPRPWIRMTFELWREAEGWRYDATFGYA